MCAIRLLQTSLTIYEWYMKFLFIFLLSFYWFLALAKEPMYSAWRVCVGVCVCVTLAKVRDNSRWESRAGVKFGT